MNHKVIIRAAGGLDQLAVIEEPVPTPKPGEALIRIEAAGAAFGDVLMRRGVAGGKFPQTPGYDLVGIVEALGPNASRVSVGDRVAALPGKGSQQQFICLPETVLVPVPSGVSSEKAVAVVLNYLTALRLLNQDAKLKAGQSAFIYGLAGGLGSAMAQIARQLGIRLYGTASGNRLAEARQEGATAFDRGNPGWVATALRESGGGFNAIFDPIGGASLTRSYGLLAPQGTLVMLGVASAVQGAGKAMPKVLGTLARLAYLKLRPGSRHVKLSVTSDAKDVERFHKNLTMLFGWLAEGKIDPAIYEVLPLADVALAQTMLEASAAHGKIVLRP